MTGRPPPSSVTPRTPAAAAASGHAGRIVDPRGRAKAYRPLAPADRDVAVDRGLAAYARGDFYLAHEELEPAWMGADDSSERALVGGLIKLAAAFVHAERGNPLGVRTNLAGALDRLADTAQATARYAGIDLPALVQDVRARLDQAEAYLAVHGASPSPRPPGDSVPGHDVVGPPSRVRGVRVPIAPPLLPRRARG